MIRERDRPADQNMEEGEVPPEMIEAGPSVLAAASFGGVGDADYADVAEDVFRAMLSQYRALRAG